MRLLDTLSPEDREELKKAYEGRPTRKDAIEDLNATINAIQQGYKEVWRTGYRNLDEKLGGGFFGEQLIFLGAISSLGKTSYALQLADQVASQGKDVLLVSLEMSSNELLAKSISRQSYLLNCGDSVEARSQARGRLNTRDILSGNVGALGLGADETNSLFIRAEKEVAKNSDHLSYIIGENDIDVDTLRLLVELYIETHNGSKPLVILDYLQILRPSTDTLDRRLEKRLATDDDVTKLKIMARDLKIPVLAISAFNRVSYLEPVSMSSFKESSGIEYSSDVLLALQFEGMDYQKHYYTDKNGNKVQGYESSQDHDNRVRELYDKMQRQAEGGGSQEIELKILKNRTGAKGSVFYDFNPTYNYYGEREGKSNTVATSNRGNDSNYVVAGSVK